MMQVFNFYGVRRDNKEFSDYEYYQKDNLLPKHYYKRKCRHCGFEMNFYIHKKKLCRICNNYIYPDDKEEFRAILNEKKRKKENE